MVQEDLYGTARGHQITVLGVEELVFEQYFCCLQIMVSGFNNDLVAIAERLFIAAINIDNGYYQTIFIKIEVCETILGTKRLPAVFKIADVVPMPNNAQGIGLIKTHRYFCSYS